MKKYDELLELLYDGALKLVKNTEHGSAADLCDLIIQVLEQSKIGENLSHICDSSKKISICPFPPFNFRRLRRVDQENWKSYQTD